MVKQDEPALLIGSPPCEAFSKLQGLSKNRVDPKKRELQLEMGKKHVETCMDLYKIQMKEGRYFLHEHPAHAESWYLEATEKVKNMPGVHV
eukprot:1715871-Karenia_brevis.AAC.1